MKREEEMKRRSKRSKRHHDRRGAGTSRVREWKVRDVDTEQTKVKTPVSDAIEERISLG